MHNLKTVILFEFLRTIKKKSFWIGTLAFPVLLVIIFALSYFSGKSASDAEKQANSERFSLVVLDDSHLIAPAALQALEVQGVTTKEAGIEQVKSGETEAFFYYPSDPSKDSIEVYGKDVGLSKNGRYEAVAKELLSGSVTAEVGSEQKIAIIRGATKTNVTTYENGETVPGFARVLAPGAFLILFYLIIVLLGNQMLTSTTEEKENRVIEMILTSVEAKTLIVGKIISLILLGALQIAVVMSPIVIGTLFFSDQLNLPALDLSQIPFDPVQMTIGALIFVFSFLLFTGILVAIGAAVPTAKEANGFFGAAIGGMFVPLYGLMAVISNPEQILVKVFSFFPLTAPVTLLLRNAAGNLATWEAVVGIAIIMVSGIIALQVATRAFRYGTLEYERKLSFKELFGR